MDRDSGTITADHARRALKASVQDAIDACAWLAENPPQPDGSLPRRRTPAKRPPDAAPAPPEGGSAEPSPTDTITPITNHVVEWVDAVDENGKTTRKSRIVYRPIGDIGTDIFALFGDDIGRIGQNLFIARKDAGGDWEGDVADFIETTSELFDQIKDRVPVQFKGGKSFDGNNLTTPEETLSHVRRKARPYLAITNRPLWPPPDDTFIRYEPNTDRDPDGGALKDFVNRFHFASPIDRDLYIAAVITAFWGGPAGKRPFFIAAPPGFGGHEQAVGKTTAFESVGKIAGGYMDISLPKHGSFADGVAKQTVEPVNLHYRWAIIDNTTGTLRDSDLARAVTATKIAARSAFMRGTERDNRITWSLTTNDLQLSSDLASRAVIIRLAPFPPEEPAPPGVERKSWEDRLDEYIRQCWKNIADDCIHILRTAPRHPIEPGVKTRNPVWDREVLALFPNVNEILRHLNQESAAANVDAEEAEQFLNDLYRQYSDSEAPFRQDSVRADVHSLTPAQLLTVWRDSFSESEATQKHVSMIIKKWIGKGMAIGLRFKKTRNGAIYEWTPKVYREKQEKSAGWVTDVTDCDGSKNDDPPHLTY